MATYRELLAHVRGVIDEISTIEAHERLDASDETLFVVVREGQSGPGPNDWEVTVRTPSAHPLEPGVHVLELDALDGSRLSGRALLRFSDGRRHLFRGDGDLVGYGGS